jgi:trans-2,3-dihydro-3-hydroxyanthranilate isomerase
VPVEIYHNGPRHVFVGLSSLQALAALDPDHRALAAFPDQATNCFAGAGDRWRNRMFSPAYGVVEDAATGSAAGPLAIHLVRHGLVTPGRPIEIEQGVEIGRSAVMHAAVTWTAGEVSTVEVGGSGALFAHGTAYV